MASFQRKHGRKLLLASIGVATVTYIGCKGQTSGYPAGNLMPPPCVQDNTCGTSSSSSSGSGGGQGGAGGQLDSGK